MFVCIDALRPSQQLRSCLDVVSIFVTYSQSENGITSNKCLKYNHPTKPQKAYTHGWFDLNRVSWAGSDQSG